MPSPEYEQFDMDGSPKSKDCCARCLGQYDPRHDPVEFLSLISLISLSMGIFLTMIGYLVPRDYKFNADEDAEKMEAMEMYYDRLAWDLDLCIIFGMGFVVVGGVILACIICYLHVTSDFWAQVCGDYDLEEERERRQEHMARRKNGDAIGAATGYGSYSVGGRGVGTPGDRTANSHSTSGDGAHNAAGNGTVDSSQEAIDTQPVADTKAEDGGSSGATTDNLGS